MEQRIQLTVEEGLEYQKFEAYMDAFAAGVAATIEHLKKKRIQEIVAQKQAAQQNPAPQS